MGEINLRGLIEVREFANHRSPIRVLGIDLGTTNSVIAEALWDPAFPQRAVVRCLDVDQPTAREGVYTSALMPSVVALYDGKEFVGEGAKRLMGLAGELGLRRNRDFFFETKNEIGTSRQYGAAPEGYRGPAEIGSRILARLVEAAGGKKADKIVVTVPASFQVAQRHDTVSAARLAGIAVADGHLMDEPIAAFMDYLATTAHTLTLPEGRQANLLVFDFGGGTCDVAIFKISRASGRTGLQVAPSSISRFHRLGGGDIDAAIVYEVLIPQIVVQNHLQGSNLSFTRKKQFIEPALRIIAESLKMGLSREIDRRRSLGLEDADNVKKVFPGRQEIPLPDRRLIFDSPALTIGDFEDVLSQFLDRYQQAPVSDEYRTARSIFGPIEDALTRAGIQAGDIDFCLLAGGSAGLPQVVDNTEDYFSNARVLRYEESEDRKATIARGAALQALSLALLGEPLVHPMCQDAIAIQTDGDPIVLIPKGASLPYPPDTEFGVSDELAVPAGAETGLVQMRVEVLAGDEHRVLFSQPWDIPAPVSRGEPVRLEYRFDANQVLELRLYKQEASRGTPFITRIEKPGTHVVNPDPKEAEADQMEQKIGPGSKLPLEQRLEIAGELADTLQELGRREKALDILTMILRERGQRDPATLNRMANLFDEMNAPEEAERYYRQAIEASPSGTGARFNLALLLRRRGRYVEAAAVADGVIQRGKEPPHLVLRASIANDLKDGALRDELLGEADRTFGTMSGLDVWELTWLRTCAEMRRDTKKVAEVRRELQRRSSETTVPIGDLPIRKPRV